MEKIVLPNGVSGNVLGPFDRLPEDVDAAEGVGAKQSFKDDCDINVIMSRYEKAGQLPLSDDVPAMFGDFSDGATFHDVMNRIRKAEEAFLTVRGEVRAMFDNDVGKFLDFVVNPANAEKLVELGLAVKKPETQAAPAQPATTSTPAG